MEDHICVCLLWINISREVWKTFLNVSLHLLLCPTPLCNITLNLPSKLDIIHNIYVNSEVKLRARLLVINGMKAFENHHFVGLNQLWRVLEACVVIVNGLVNCFALLERLNLCTHQREVVLFCIQCGEAWLFPAASPQAQWASCHRSTHVWDRV